MTVAGIADEPFAGLAQTHSAVVFFAGGYAFKLKKPVDLGFLDFRTPQARGAACAREAELNRRFAPDVYVGVARLQDPTGRLDEHLVMMRRLPASTRLSTLVGAGRPVGGPVRQIARKLAIVHAASPRRPEITEQGGRDALLARWRANLAQARGLPGAPLRAPVTDEVQRLAERFLAGREPLLASRMRAGRVVDGHGDLLADDIFCLGDGPRILDCLEFDDRLRWLDGLDDAACLAMDLERLGAPELAEQFITWYAEFSGDPVPASLRHHYTAYRAFMRAKIAGLRCGQGDPSGAGEARELAAIALRHLRASAVTLVLVGGLPGTGKSTLAGQIASRFGGTVLSSDRLRKELAGVTPQTRCPAAYLAGIYTPAWTQRTYTELLDRAARLLGHGEMVIADASWISPEHRSAAATVARNAAADLVQLQCTAPAALATGRITARPAGPSDAGSLVAERMKATQAPWETAVIIDTASSEDPVGTAVAAIRPHQAGPV